MRMIRRLLTFWLGAAFGAGVVYLFDPEHGPQRRRQARRQALAQARVGAVAALRNGRASAGELARAAVAGYQASRSEPAGGEDRSLRG